MLKLREAIVVEGKYDKNTLSQLVDAPIFQTDGFGIFKNHELLTLLRQVAESRGLIVFMDSDGAGFVIRNYLKSAIPPEHLKHAYIPDIYGKERRKQVPGKEGKLGVEGMRPEVLLEALRRAGATELDGTVEQPQKFTKQDLIALGLSGGQGSAERRKRLQRALSFPEHMSANALVQALSVLYTAEEVSTALAGLEKDNG